MMQDKPKANWDALLDGLWQFKINSAVALAVVLFFAVSAGAITLVAHTEMATSGYEPILGQSQTGSGRVLGIASYGYNQPVCGRNTSSCLNHMLIGYNGSGWQVRIDYQLQYGIVGAIRVNGWPFMDNISGSGSGYTGNDLLPGKTYNFILYRKAGSRLIKITNLSLTAPEAPEKLICPKRPISTDCYLDYSQDSCGTQVCPPEPDPVWCAQDAYQCPDGNWVSRTGPNCTFACPTPSYGYAAPITDLQITNVRETENANVLAINICVQGSKSINDIKKETPAVQNFPILYSIDYQNTQITRIMGAAGGIEDIKNGTCFELYSAIQPEDITAWQANKRVTYVLDTGNLIPETNESNNYYTYQGLVAAKPRIGQFVNLSGTIVLVGENGVYGVPSIAVFNSWGWSLSQVLFANKAEAALPQIGIVPLKSQYCNSALEQIQGKCPVSTEPIKVLSPNGGESWAKASKQTFTFTNNSGSAVNIYLKPYLSCLYSNPRCMIAEPMPYLVASNVTGAITVFIDKDLNGRDIPAGQYLARIETVGGSYADESDAPFSLVSSASSLGPISLTSAVYYKGGAYGIKWESKGVDKVYIKLRKRSVGDTVAAVSPTIDNTGYFEWTVPTDLKDGDDYSFRVVSANGGVYADSGEFSIKSEVLACFPIPEMQCRSGETVRWYTDNGCTVPRCEPLSTGGSSGSGSSNSGSSSSGGNSGAGAYPSYRYIKIETPQSNSWASWREIEIYGADGQKITPVSSAVSGVYSSSAGSRAYDGDTMTAWISGSYTNSFITLDLGSDKQVSKIRILPANYPSPATSTHYVKVKSSSGANFTEATRYDGQITDNQWLTYNASP